MNVFLVPTGLLRSCHGGGRKEAEERNEGFNPQNA